MSKNIYRVNKKNDLDEIIKNNYYKPICIVFLSKNDDPDAYKNITMSLIEMSKILTYIIIVVINFDDFIDNTNYFLPIKSTLPFFRAYFVKKIIGNFSYDIGFVPKMITYLEDINTHYIIKLKNCFENNIPISNIDKNQNQNNSNLNNNFDNINNSKNHNKNIKNNKNNKKNNKNNKNNKKNNKEEEEEEEDEDDNIRSSMVVSGCAKYSFI